MGTATVDEVQEFIGKENLWSEYGGDLKSERSEWVQALAEFIDYRFASFSPFNIERDS